MIELFEPRTILLAAFGVLVLALAIRSLRGQRLKERYTLLFVFVGLPFLVLAVWPDAVVFFSDWLRIEKPTFMIFCLAAFTILLLLKLLALVSVQDRKIQELAQVVAILREQKRRDAEYGQPEARPPSTGATDETELAGPASHPRRSD